MCPGSMVRWESEAEPGLMPSLGLKSLLVPLGLPPVLESWSGPVGGEGAGEVDCVSVLPPLLAVLRVRST